MYKCMLWFSFLFNGYALFVNTIDVFWEWSISNYEEISYIELAIIVNIVSLFLTYICYVFEKKREAKI